MPFYASSYSISVLVNSWSVIKRILESLLFLFNFFRSLNCGWLIFSTGDLNIVGTFFHNVRVIVYVRGWLIFSIRNLNIAGKFSVLVVANAKAFTIVCKEWSMVRLQHVLLFILFCPFADFVGFLFNFLIWNRIVYI